MKPWIGSLLLAGLCLPLPVLGQDDTPPPAPKRADVPEEPEPPQEKRVRVLVLQDDGEDGEGPSEPRVLILEGDELDGLDLPLPPGAAKGGARLRIRGEDGEGYEFDLSAEGDLSGEHDLEGLRERMQEVRKRLKRVLGDKAPPELGGLLDPEALTARIEQQIARSQASRTKRLRDDALRALKLEGDVAALVGPLLDRVLEARRELERDQTQGRALLRKDLVRAKTEDALQQLLSAFRERAGRARQVLATAREKLREVLTLQQELELVVREILD